MNAASTCSSIFCPASPRTERGRSMQIQFAAISEPLLVYTNGTSAIVRHYATDNNNSNKRDRLFGRHPIRIRVARLDPFAHSLATGDERGKIRVWTLTDEDRFCDRSTPLKPKHEYDVLAGAINDLDWSFDSERIAVGGEGRERFGHVFTVSTGTSIGEIMGMSRAINTVSFRPIRPFRVATGSEDGLICVFEGPPFKLAKRVDGHCSFMNVVKYSPDGSFLACAGAGGTVFILDGTKSDILKSFKHSEKSASVLGLCWSPTTNLCTTGTDRILNMWDVAGELVGTYSFGDELDDQQVGCTAGPQLICVSLSGRINLLSVSNTNIKFERSIDGHSKAVSSICSVQQMLFSISIDGHFLIFSERDVFRSLNEFKLKDDRLYSTALVSSTSQSCAWIAVNEKLIWIDIVNQSSRPVLVAENHILKLVAIDEHSCVAMLIHRLLWVSIDEEKGVCTIESEPFLQNLTALHYCKGGNAATGDEQGNVHLFKLVENRFNLYKSFVADSTIAAQSPGRNIISLTFKINNYRAFEKRVQFLFPKASTSNAKEKYSPYESDSSVVSLSFSPDGRYLAVAVSTHFLFCYSCEGEWENVSADLWHHHAAKITQICWSPDSKLVASCGVDSHIFVYDPEKIRSPVRKVYNAHVYSPIQDIAWTTNQSIVSAGMDAHLKEWVVKEHLDDMK